MPGPQRPSEAIVACGGFFIDRWHHCYGLALALPNRIDILADMVDRHLPDHLDVVDHLIDAFDPANRFLGKLLVVEARHLASEE